MLAGLTVAVVAGTYLGVMAIAWLARRLDVVDKPNARSSHHRPIPLGGGVVLVAVNLIGWTTAAFSHANLPGLHVRVFAAAALIVASISLVDDLSHVPVSARLVAHLSAALLVVVAFGAVHSVDIPVIGIVGLGAAGTVLTCLWIVGLVNAYNFVDGLDGLAAGQALTAGAGWSMLGFTMHRPTLTAIGALVAASSLGFLVHNWHPATIFMGDVGSTFLGLSFAVLTVVAAHYGPRFVLPGLLLVWPVLFDSTFTVLRRLRNRQSVFTGHREFLFHRLADSGWGHTRSAALYTCLPVAGAVLALYWETGGGAAHLVVGGGMICLCTGLWLVVCRCERRQRAECVDRRRAWRSGEIATGAMDRPDRVAVNV
ncbi:MAG TPA: glycosyltransferase family 4 protein [Chloroflexota bacterium]|nr:glycosyltransferase family 4 protein [Chloroflexota bacterium]